MSTKTANKQYKEYKREGGTLSFKEWIVREKKKSFLNFDGETTTPPLNKPLNDSIQSALTELRKADGYQTTTDKNYFLGLPVKPLVIAGAVVAVGLTVFLVYKYAKK